LLPSSHTTNGRESGNAGGQAVAALPDPSLFPVSDWKGLMQGDEAMHATRPDQAGQPRADTRKRSDRGTISAGQRIARVLVHALAGLPWLLQAACCPAAPGDFDSSFGNGGRRLVDVSVQGKYDKVARLIVRADGKLLMGGTCQFQYDVRGFNSETFCVTQLRPDGSYDGNFGPGGVGYLQFNTISGWPIGSGLDDMIILRDGRIALLGYDLDGNKPMVAVLLADGSALDSTVGGGKGFVEFTLSAQPGTELETSLIEQPDGKILVAGSAPGISGNQDFAVTRLLANLSGPDPSFGSNGYQSIAFDLGGPGGDDSDYCVAVRLQSDGKIVLSGDAATYPAGQSPTGYEIGITRLNVNGTRDLTFGNGGDGRVHYAAGGVALAVDAQIDSADRIVVGGEFLAAIPATEGKWLVDRLSRDGARDPSFNQGNPKIFSPPVGHGGGTIHRLALTRDGIYAIGDTRRTAPPAASNNYFAVARLHANGSLDSRFGDAGQVFGSYATTNDVDATGTDIGIGQSGVLVAGTQTQAVMNSNDNIFKFAIARLQDVPPFDLIGHKGAEACWSKAVTEPAFLGLVGSNVEGNTACIPPFVFNSFNGTAFVTYNVCYTAACPGGNVGCPVTTHTGAFGVDGDFGAGQFSATGTADSFIMAGVSGFGTCNYSASAITTSYATDYIFTDDGNHGDYAALLNQFTAAPTNVALSGSGSDPSCGSSAAYLYPYFYAYATVGMSAGLKQKLQSPTVGKAVCPAQ